MNKPVEIAELELNNLALDDQLVGCARAAWRMLAVVPTRADLSAMWFADALVHRCNASSPGRAKLFCGERLSREGALRLISEMGAWVEAGGRAVVAIEAMSGKRSGAPIALASDGVLLCVHLGVSTSEDAKRAISAIGRERFIGAATIEHGRPGKRA
jgi:hypothetical protein